MFLALNMHCKLKHGVGVCKSVVHVHVYTNNLLTFSHFLEFPGMLSFPGINEASSRP